MAKMAYTITEACEQMSVSRTMLYKLIKSGELSARKVGSKTIILGSEINKCLARLPKMGER